MGDSIDCSLGGYRMPCQQAVFYGVFEGLYVDLKLTYMCNDA